LRTTDSSARGLEWQRASIDRNNFMSILLFEKYVRVPHFFDKTGNPNLDLNQIARWRSAQF
jgi:hypothetical protein